MRYFHTFLACLISFFSLGSPATPEAADAMKQLIDLCHEVNSPAAALKHIEDVQKLGAKDPTSYVSSANYEGMKRTIILYQGLYTGCEGYYMKAAKSGIDLDFIYTAYTTPNFTPRTTAEKKMYDKMSKFAEREADAKYKKNKKYYEKIDADKPPASLALPQEYTGYSDSFDIKTLDAYYANKWYGYPILKEYAALENAARQIIAKYGRDARSMKPKASNAATGTASTEGCAFSACTAGKSACCQMARDQMNACAAADAANQTNYSANPDELTGMAAGSIRECVRCSAVWLKINGC